MKPIALNGQMYTHSIALKSIHNDQKSLISFAYATKTSGEVRKLTPVENDKVVFPMPLSEDFYLTSVKIETESLSQQFRFDYRLDGNDRLMIEFKQILMGSAIESILKMDYVKLNDQRLMKTIVLPRRSTVFFEHTKLNRVVAENSLVKIFPVGD